MHSLDWRGLCYAEQRASDDGQRKQAEVIFHHNGDFSGNVRIDLPNWLGDICVHHGAGPNQEGMAEVHIPFEAMKALVLEYYRQKMVTKWEAAYPESLEELLRETMEEDALEQEMANPFAVTKHTDESPETRA